MIFHKSVMTAQVLEYLDPQPGGVYIDATLGAGGHTRAILQHEPACTVIGIEWNRQTLDAQASALTQEFGDRFKPVWGNFAQLPLLIKRENMGQVTGILADFGTSQYEIKELAGFSFARDTRLDMRMSPAHQRVQAADILNHASEKELSYIFYTYGQERHARALARALVETRRKHPITTTKALAEFVIAVTHRKPVRGKIHPATKVFQALRIAVNHELDNIKALLTHARTVLLPGGRLVCISFHSLEDRLVKQFLRSHQQEFTILTPRVIRPTIQEIRENPSARSALLRAAERTTI